MAMLLDRMPRTPSPEGPKKLAAGRVSAKTYERLLKIAHAEKRTVSQVIEFACDEYVDRYEAARSKRKQ
jgi:6-phosphogluconolactonase/glucosamine-6-phosphate isomerase/deaminase